MIVFSAAEDLITHACQQRSQCLADEDELPDVDQREQNRDRKRGEN
jgi:hypothetical protein